MRKTILRTILMMGLIGMASHSYLKNQLGQQREVQREESSSPPRRLH
jgi:hypothetical protein